MFDIGFINDEPPYRDEDGWSGFWARIVIGEFTERFVAPTEWWSRADYERQWIDGAQRLLGGARTSAFVEEPGRVWWTAWREGDEVYLQHRLLVDPSMAPAWSAGVGELPYDLVGPREPHSGEEHRASVWVVTNADLRAFVDRKLGG